MPPDRGALDLDRSELKPEQLLAHQQELAVLHRSLRVHAHEGAIGAPHVGQNNLGAVVMKPAVQSGYVAILGKGDLPSLPAQVHAIGRYLECIADTRTPDDEADAAQETRVRSAHRFDPIGRVV